MGESANVPRLPAHPLANAPLLGVIDHAHELTEYVFVRVTDYLEFGVTDLAVAKGELKCATCVSAASPSESLSFEMKAAVYRHLRHASAIFCADGSRRATNLIG